MQMTFRCPVLLLSQTALAAVDAADHTPPHEYLSAPPSAAGPTPCPAPRAPPFQAGVPAPSPSIHTQVHLHRRPALARPPLPPFHTITPTCSFSRSATLRNESHRSSPSSSPPTPSPPSPPPSAPSSAASCQADAFSTTSCVRAGMGGQGGDTQGAGAPQTVTRVWRLRRPTTGTTVVEEQATTAHAAATPRLSTRHQPPLADPADEHRQASIARLRQRRGLYYSISSAVRHRFYNLARHIPGVRILDAIMCRYASGNRYQAKFPCGLCESPLNF